MSEYKLNNYQDGQHIPTGKMDVKKETEKLEEWNKYIQDIEKALDAIRYIDENYLIHPKAIGKVSLQEVEKELIDLTLQHCNGSRRKAVKILNMSERTIYRKINEYGLREDEK